MFKEPQEMDYTYNRKVLLLKTSNNIFYWVIFMRNLRKNHCKLAVMMARSNVTNFYHDFDSTRQKFTVEISKDRSISKTSKSILWDSTLKVHKETLIMNRYVLMPYIRISNVFISISTRKQEEITNESEQNKSL